MELQGMAPEVAKKFKYWQTRTIIASMIGYALFYFVRKNLSIAMPAMQDDLGITKGDLGLFLTLHGLLYGVSKFANGFCRRPGECPLFYGNRFGALCSM